MSGDLEQRRRTVRVLELLDESYRAHADGDEDGARAAMDRAAGVDTAALSGIHGGIIIGEIPSPERDYPAWVDYLDAARDALTEAEGATSSLVCTGVTAQWCPVHGECACPPGTLGDPGCPLHAFASTHCDVPPAVTS